MTSTEVAVIAAAAEARLRNEYEHKMAKAAQVLKASAARDHRTSEQKLLKLREEKEGLKAAHRIAQAKSRALANKLTIEKDKFPWYWRKRSFNSGSCSDGTAFATCDVTVEMKASVEWAMNKFAKPESHGFGRDSHAEKFEKFEVESVQLVKNPSLWQRYIAWRAASKDTENRVAASSTSTTLGGIGGRGLARRSTGSSGGTARGICGNPTPAPLMRQFKPPKMLREPLQVASNEVYLFHGTPEAICDAVLREGFDSRLGSGLFGQGSYFAESASKSDQYVADKHPHRLFRVHDLRPAEGNLWISC
jgi:hypothetical protein